MAVYLLSKSEQRMIDGRVKDLPKNMKRLLALLQFKKDFKIF